MRAAPAYHQQMTEDSAHGIVQQIPMPDERPAYDEADPPLFKRLKERMVLSELVRISIARTEDLALVDRLSEQPQDSSAPPQPSAGPALAPAARKRALTECKYREEHRVAREARLLEEIAIMELDSFADKETKALAEDLMSEIDNMAPVRRGYSLARSPGRRSPVNAGGAEAARVSTVASLGSSPSKRASAVASPQRQPARPVSARPTPAPSAAPTQATLVGKPRSSRGPRVLGGPAAAPSRGATPSSPYLAKPAPRAAPQNPPRGMSAKRAPAREDRPRPASAVSKFSRQSTVASSAGRERRSSLSRGGRERRTSITQAGPRGPTIPHALIPAKPAPGARATAASTAAPGTVLESILHVGARLRQNLSTLRDDDGTDLAREAVSSHVGNAQDLFREALAGAFARVDGGGGDAEPPQSPDRRRVRQMAQWHLGATRGDEFRAEELRIGHFARVIQRHARVWLRGQRRKRAEEALLQRHRENAARCIQRAWRAHQSRQIRHALRIQHLAKSIAARRIQKAVRRMLRRLHMGRLAAEPTRAERIEVENHWLWMKEVAVFAARWNQLEPVRSRAALRVQSFWRGETARRVASRRAHAVHVIQRWARGWLVRRWGPLPVPMPAVHKALQRRHAGFGAAAPGPSLGRRSSIPIRKSLAMGLASAGPSIANLRPVLPGDATTEDTLSGTRASMRVSESEQGTVGPQAGPGQRTAAPQGVLRARRRRASYAAGMERARHLRLGRLLPDPVAEYKDAFRLRRRKEITRRYEATRAELARSWATQVELSEGYLAHEKEVERARAYADRQATLLQRQWAEYYEVVAREALEGPLPRGWIPQVDPKTGGCCMSTSGRGRCGRRTRT
ncbi:unnamed protein product [Pedinophyceae sp. YPF-701]|nr:unnamed protein product [Pedinophyceae sp. YPF-701]